MYAISIQNAVCMLHPWTAECSEIAIAAYEAGAMELLVVHLDSEVHFLFKGLRPLPPTPDFWIFGFFGKCRFWEFSGGIRGLGGFAIDRKWLWDSNRRILSPNQSIWVHFPRFWWFWSFWCRFRWSDAASGRSQDPPRVPWRSRDPVRVSCPTGRN